MRRSDFIKRMERRLRSRRSELLAQLTGELSHLRLTDEATVGDSADLAVEEDYGHINAQLAALAGEELRQISEALDRIANGTYGICERCGAHIPVARLTVVPFATLCVRCRQDEERQRPQEERIAHWGRVAEAEAETEAEEGQTDFESLTSELAA